MRKIFTILMLLLSIAGISSKAQTLNCNAAFTTAYQNGNTIQFIPAVPGTVANTLHFWNFGDGGTSNLVSPVHTYTSGSLFTVQHITGIYINGAVICRDTVYMTVQVQNSCNLFANFYSFRDSILTVPNLYHFINTTTPLNANDSIRWTFGDGSSSNQVNPDHIYTQPGTYTVCLRVQQRTNTGTLSNCISEICHPVVVLSPTTCNLVANFTFAQVPGTVNTYQFQNTSAPLNPTDSIRWTFGDGTSSNQLNPNHTFTQPGTYNVCLRIIQRTPNGALSNCIREICRIVIVQNSNACNLIANFTITPVTATPTAFHFINTSTPLNATDSVRWTFGDGTSSNEMNPTHTYAQAGTYTVCIRVQQRNPNGVLSNCIREKCLTLVVQNTTVCNLIANFTFSSVAGAVNTYYFQNTSIPLNSTDSIRWTFGDGTTSNQMNPNHTYTQAGTYNVCLRVQQRNPNGMLTNCIREKCLTLVVQNTTVCNLVANFYSYRDSTVANSLTYHFENTSAPLNNTDSIRWTFGDGTTSNQVSPNHTYTQPGTYTVCLRIIQRTSTGALTNCIREKCLAIVIGNPITCNLVANFTTTLLQTAPNTYHFQNTSTPLNANDSIRWTFGDGTSSNQVNPNHTFALPGTYNVCLRVQQRTNTGSLSNCIRLKCMTIFVQTTTTCNLTANFYSYRDTLSMTPVAFLYHFVNTSTPLNNTDSIRWTFGDGTSSNLVSPAHVYAQPGTYYVCLRIQKRNNNGALTNCVREICRYVYVGQVAPPNACFIQTFPNPATTFVNFNVYLSLPQMIDVYVYNFSNVLVREKHQQGVVGNNTVSISTATLPPGIYRMRVVRGNNVCYSNFVKL